MFTEVVELEVFKGLLAGEAHPSPLLYLHIDCIHFLCSVKDKRSHQAWNDRAHRGRQLTHRSLSFHTGAWNACNVYLIILLRRGAWTTHSSASAKSRGPVGAEIAAPGLNRCTHHIQHELQHQKLLQHKWRCQQSNLQVSTQLIDILLVIKCAMWNFRPGPQAEPVRF